MLTVGSLFSGVGGIDLGLERTGGFKTVWQVENDEYATKVLARHWPDVRRWGDVRTFPPDAERPECESGTGRRGVREGDPLFADWHVDLIAGGFPCQPVSLAGAQRGDSDTRWLWPEMYRVCKLLRPRFVLVENVPGLRSADGGRLFGRVVADLAAIWPCVWWDSIPAAAVGAPHIRDRVFIVAYTEQHGLQGRKSAERSPPDLRRRFAEQGGAGNAANTEQHGREQGPEVSQGRESIAAVCGGDGGGGEGFDGSQSRRWATRPRLCRVDDGLSPRLDRYWRDGEWPDQPRVERGVPNRVARLKCLGNAVVPAVAEYIGHRILELEKQ